MQDGTKTSREVAWCGLDDTERLDVVSVEFDARGGLVATGTQSTATYRARWDLAVDTTWRTRMVTVDVEGLLADGASEESLPWQRHLNLWREDAPDGRSRWRCEVGESGEVPAHLGEPGLGVGATERLADAFDVDLSGCPLTNTMPVRRLGLLEGSERDEALTTAWISLPDLGVHPAEQSYGPAAEGLVDIASALDPEVAAVVHYRSRTRGVSVDLSLDADGIVLTYPDLAARLQLD